MSEPIVARPGTKHVCNIPADAGKIVAMCTWDDQIVVACEYAAFMLNEHPYRFDKIFEIKRSFATGIPLPEPIKQCDHLWQRSIRRDDDFCTRANCDARRSRA